MNKVREFYKELEADIKDAYEFGVTLDQAEKLAAKFLEAQMQVSHELTSVDLDSRLRKTGVKSIRAAIYLDETSKAEKKPTEATLTALIDSNDIVCGEQRSFDEAEVRKAELERYFDIFKDAHVYFRGVAKGRFE